MNRSPGLKLFLLALAAMLGGCARGGEDVPSPVPEAVLDIVWAMNAPVNDAFYYYVAFDTDDDQGADFPVPVASGPYWGNGWGAGSITHFLEYHVGEYRLYKTDLDVEVREKSGGFVDVLADITGADTGEYTITVSALTLGAATLTGGGAIASVTNNGDQNAGTLALATNSDGTVVPGSVVFTPAADGGRELDTAEEAQVDALNTGALLEPDSLDELGLTLTLTAGPDLSGSQTITVAAAVADVAVVFESASTGDVGTSTATVTANSSQSTADPPIADVDLVTADLVVDDRIVIGVVVAETATLIGPPYEYVTPLNSNTLRATVDLDDLGRNLTNISINFITTTELIFDPTMVNPDDNNYDGLGRLGNDAIRLFDPTEFLTISNDTAFIQEEAGDSTLAGPASQYEQAQVDIIDWEITPRRLR